MARDDSITVSFRLNLSREDDIEIQKFLLGDTMKICFGDKSKFIKNALIRVIQGIKRDEENARLVCEMNTQRATMEETMTLEADRIINAVKLIVQDEIERVTGMQMVKEKQVSAESRESMPKEIKEPVPCFGEVPESSGEDVSEDVMAFLEEL